jgi:hypothetical protein
MFAKNAALTACACAFLMLGLPAASQTPERLVDRYTDLAGSQNNAQSLVTGLRDGSKIRLSEGTTTVVIDPPTQKMGYGNVDNALALAEASLKGIAEPTPEQLKAALIGGSVKTDSGSTVKLDGVLQMRADGMGWGQIANALGFRLGDVKRSEKAPERIARSGRADSAQPERLERPHKPERPVRPERPERPTRPGK